MNDRTSLEWLDAARSFARNAHNLAREATPAAFAEDQRTQYAIRYCLAIVGEALNNVPTDVQALAPDVPWRAAYNLRNRLIHGFWLIDTQIILSIARDDAAPLAVSIDRLMEQIAP